MKAGQRGSASVVVLMLITLAIVILQVCLIVSSAVFQNAQVQAVADLAALSAADHLRWDTGLGLTPQQMQERSACVIAQMVASENSMELIDCEVVASSGVFSVQVSVEMGGAALRPIRNAQARAGPQY